MKRLGLGVFGYVALFAMAFCANNAFAGLVSQYTFNRDTMFRAKVGQDAYEGTMPVGSTIPVITNEMVNITRVTDPAVLNGRAGVIAIPTGTTLAIPNPGLTKTWTMVLHFYAPKAGLSNNCDTFFQIGSIDNSSGGSLFLQGGTGSDGSIGVQTFEAVTGVFDSWHQLVVSCNNGAASIWYDGTKISKERTYDLTAMRFIYLSLDKDGKDGTLYFDEVRLYDEATPDDIFDGGAAQVIASDTDAETPYADEFISASVTPEVIELGDEFAYVFSRVGSFTFTPARAQPAQLLLVGGGGAGGMIRGGGGGGGGMIYTNSFALEAQTYHVTVGAGGVPAVNPYFIRSIDQDLVALGFGMTPAYACGGCTSISTNGVEILSAVGGGGGGNFVNRDHTTYSAEGIGLDGGSSGGSAGKCLDSAAASDGQGNVGGAGFWDSDNVSGGGGGAGGAGGACVNAAKSGAGGIGRACDVTGTSVFYAGGGGASGYERPATAGGAGGGGIGPNSLAGTLPVPAMNGVNGLGGGGGGGNGYKNNMFWSGGGAGGSGVLILRVANPDSPNGTAGVSGIGPDHATLSATVTSFGGEATRAFVSMVYGTSQDGADAVTAFQDVEVVEEGAGASVMVSGLGRSVRYYALATISNEVGSVVYRGFEFVSSDQDLLDATSYRKQAEVTVSGYTGSETLRDFPVLLRLRSGTPRGFLAEDCAEGGADLRFADADGILMDSEVEVWDPDGESIVWVRVPELPPSGTTFTMRYSADPSATLQPVDSAGVWKGYAGVWHMNDADEYNYTDDSTANANHGKDNSRVKPAGTGPVGGARNMGDSHGSGSSPKCGTIVPAAVSLKVAPNFSFSFWSQFHTNPNNSWSHFLNRRKGDTDTGGWALQWRNGNLSFATCGAQNNDSVCAVFGAGAANAVSNWTHVVYSVAGSEITFYLNGVLVGTKTATAGAAAGNDRGLGIGTKYDTTDSYGGLNGDMDEVRLRVGAVSADWAKATHASMASGSFVSYRFPLPTVIFIR